MSAYRPYPKYKTSGVEWLGDVPVGWEVARIKNVATINASKSEVSRLDYETEVSFLPMEAVGDDGSLDTSTTRQLGDVLTGYTYVRENDVLVAKITPCFENGKGCIARGLNNGIGFATTEVVPIRPNKRSIPEFLYYLLHGLPFRKVAEGSMYGAGGQKRVSDNFVAGYSFALPPLPEQIQIATFLDRECGKLDALQAKQERLIDLLKEKRQALISHTVTKGLDPNAKLKPSGIEWLGDVPVGWVVRKLGLIGNFKGGAGFPDDHQGETENEIPFFKVGDIVNSDEMGVMRQANHTITRETARFLRAFIFPAGTIVFAKVGAALLLKRFRSLGQPSCIDNNMMGMAVGKDAQPGFLLYVLPLLDFSLFVNPGAVPSVNEGQISSQRIPLPPLPEQRAIVAYLDDKCGRMDALIAKAERAIALLKERRSALISAAVTGKIDVREKVKLP